MHRRCGFPARAAGSVLLPLPCQKALKALCFQGFLLFLGVSQIRSKTAKYGIKVCQKCVRKKEGFPSFFYQFYFVFCLFPPASNGPAFVPAPAGMGKAPAGRFPLDIPRRLL